MKLAYFILFFTASLASPGLAADGSVDGRPVAAEVELQEVTVGFDLFKAIYLNGGVDGRLPRVVIYSPDGACLGVLGVESLGRLLEDVVGLVQKPSSDCRVVIGNEPGMRSPSLAAGPGVYSGHLVVFDADFCGACQALERELRGIQRSDSPVKLWTMVRVNLDTEHNPGYAPASTDCEGCEKSDSP